MKMLTSFADLHEKWTGERARRGDQVAGGRSERFCAPQPEGLQAVITDQ
jgi:hypothetical protein